MSIYFQLLQGKHLEMKQLGHKVCLCLTKKLTNTFPQLLYRFMLPLAGYKRIPVVLRSVCQSFAF